MSDPVIDRTAVVSACGTYRYRLSRRWGPAGGRYVAWVMLNPSTADAERDDATVRRVVSYSQAWGYDEAFVVNVFALRATDPAALKAHPDPVGPDNHWHVEAVCRNAKLVVAAWGANMGGTIPELRVRHDLAKWGGAKCLGLTRDGHPKHPLRLRKDEVPRDFIKAVKRASD